MDDDIIGFDDNHISILLNYFGERPWLAAVNFRIVDHVNGNLCNWIHHCTADRYSQKEFHTYEITEGAVAFRRSALNVVGHYPETFFISHEGLDLALRLLNMNYEVLFSPRVQVTHYHAKSGRKPWLNYYYDTRNHFWIAARHFPVPYAFLYLSRGLLSMLAYSIRDRFFVYWCKAVVNGLRGLPQAFKERSTVNPNVLRLIRNLNRNRPSLGFYIRERLLQRKVRL